MPGMEEIQPPWHPQLQGPEQHPCPGWSPGFTSHPGGTSQLDGDKAGRFSLPSNPGGSNPGSETSRSLSPLRPQPPRCSEGRAGTETAARGEGAAAPPAPPAAIAASPDPLHLCTTRSGARCPTACTRQTPRREGGSHPAHLIGVGVLPGGRPTSLSLGGCPQRWLPGRGCATPQVHFDGLPLPPANKFCHYF